MGHKIYWNTGGEDAHNSKYTWINWFGRTVKLPVPEKEGCEFCGWFRYDINRPDEVERIEEINKLDQRTFHLYALWKKDGEIIDCYEELNPKVFENIKEPKIHFPFHLKYFFNPSEKIPDYMPKKYDGELPYKLPAPPERIGYEFKGWYRKHPGINHLIKLVKLEEDLPRNLIVYAKWVNEDGEIDNCYRDITPDDFIKADEIITTQKTKEYRQKKKVNIKIRNNCYDMILEHIAPYVREELPVDAISDDEVEAVNEFLKNTNVSIYDEELSAYVEFRCLNEEAANLFIDVYMKYELYKFVGNDITLLLSKLYEKYDQPMNDCTKNRFEEMYKSIKMSRSSYESNENEINSLFENKTFLQKIKTDK